MDEMRKLFALPSTVKTNKKVECKFKYYVLQTLLQLW